MQDKGYRSTKNTAKKKKKEKYIWDREKKTTHNVKNIKETRESTLF